jgi:hypothetical protein
MDLRRVLVKRETLCERLLAQFGNAPVVRAASRSRDHSCANSQKELRHAELDNG